jgi:hypothetical protein
VRVCAAHSGHRRRRRQLCRDVHPEQWTNIFVTDTGDPSGNFYSYVTSSTSSYSESESGPTTNMIDERKLRILRHESEIINVVSLVDCMDTEWSESGLYWDGNDGLPNLTWEKGRGISGCNVD